MASLASPSYVWTGFLIALLVPLGLSLFSPLPFAFLIPLIALSGVIGLRVTTGCWLRPDWPLYGWIASICVLCLLSATWAIDPDGTFGRAIKTSALLLLSIPLIDLARICPREAFTKIRHLIPGLLLVMGVALSAEILLNFPAYRFFADIPAGEIVPGSFLNKNVVVFILLVPIALTICLAAQKYVLGVLLLAVAALLLVVTESQAAQLAVFVMIVAWAVAFVLPVAGIPMVFAGLAVVVCLMPWLAPIAFDTLADKLTQPHLAARASASARLENWDFIARKIMENPWTGFGMDLTRTITDFKTDKLYFPSDRIMHPHNFALQIWIEFGVPGVLVICGFLGFLLRRLLVLPRPAQRLHFAVFCSALTFLLLSWSLWSAWLLALLIYLSAVLLLATDTTPAPATSSPPH